MEVWLYESDVEGEGEIYYELALIVSDTRIMIGLNRDLELEAVNYTDKLWEELGTDSTFTYIGEL